MPPPGFPLAVPIEFVFTFVVDATATVRNLVAKSSCEGRQIDLSWEAPFGVTVLEYRVKRSKRAFSLFVNDDTELVSSGTTDLTFSDTGLEENVFYYYTVFYTSDGTNYFVSDGARVIGHSFTDYKAVFGEHWLWDRLPKEVKRLDANAGVDAFVTQRYLDVLQCGLMHMMGMVEGYEHLPDYDDIPAGRVGEAKNQYGIIEAINEELGFPPQRALGIETMRRVALELPAVRKSKGTCPGLVEFVKLLTTWDVECVDLSTGACGAGGTLRTWNGFASLVRGTGTLVGVGGQIDNTAGQFTDGAASFTPNLYKLGMAIDAFGNVACVEDNTATVLTFDTTHAAQQLVPEETWTTVPAGTNIILTGTDHSSGVFKPFNDHMFKGYKIKDSAGTVRDILDNDTTAADGSVTTLRLSGAVVTGVASIAKDFANEPLSYANRQPVLAYTVYHNEHTFLWNPQFDLRLRPTRDNPFDVLWGGSSGAGAPTPGPSDVILWVQAGVATAIGESTAVTADTLTDAGAAFGSLAGFFVNPNRDQPQILRIASNIATAVTIDPGADLTDLGAVGDSYVILSPLNAMRYQALVQTVQQFVPYGTRVYIYFL